MNFAQCLNLRIFITVNPHFYKLDHSLNMIDWIVCFTFSCRAVTSVALFVAYPWLLLVLALVLQVIILITLSISNAWIWDPQLLVLVMLVEIVLQVSYDHTMISNNESPSSNLHQIQVWKSHRFNHHSVVAFRAVFSLSKRAQIKVSNRRRRLIVLHHTTWEYHYEYSDKKWI